MSFLFAKLLKFSFNNIKNINLIFLLLKRKFSHSYNDLSSFFFFFVSTIIFHYTLIDPNQWSIKKHLSMNDKIQI